MEWKWKAKVCGGDLPVGKWATYGSLMDLKCVCYAFAVCWLCVGYALAMLSWVFLFSLEVVRKACEVCRLTKEKGKLFGRVGVVRSLE